MNAATNVVPADYQAAVQAMFDAMTQIEALNPPEGGRTRDAVTAACVAILAQRYGIDETRAFLGQLAGPTGEPFWAVQRAAKAT